MKALKYALIGATVLNAGCMGMTTKTQETSSAYAIYDIQSTSEVSHSVIAQAVLTGLKKSTSAVRASQDIPPTPLPQAPGRFDLTNPFEGSKMAALASASGQSLKVPSCKNAILTANAADTAMSKYGEKTTFFACLLPYEGGYHIDFYTTFTKKSGAFSVETLGATLARTVVGDSSQFIPRTIQNVITEVENTGAKANLVEAYP